MTDERFTSIILKSMQALRLRMQNKLNHDPTLSPQYRESIMKMLDYTIHEVLGEDFM